MDVLKTMTSRPSLGLFLVVACLVVIFLPAVSLVHSFDIFWQLASGRYLIETGQFIRTDTFTLAPDAPRFQHTWLHDVLVYGIYKIAGYAGISWWKGLTVTATAATLALTARIRHAGWSPILLVLPVFFLSRGGWLERPQLWSFFCFALFLLVLELHKARAGRSIWWLLPVMAFWVNVHAGSVLAAALIIAYLVGGAGDLFLRSSPLTADRYKRLWLVTPLLFGIGALTPYPSQLWRTLLSVANYGVKVDSSTGQASGPMTALFNMDWSPTSFAVEPVFYYCMAISAVIVVLGWRRWSLIDLCLLGGLALMGLKLRRHIPFFYMGMIAILPGYLTAISDVVKERLPGRFQLMPVGVLGVAGLVLLVYFAKPAYHDYGVLQTGLRSWHYPVAASDYLRQQQLPGNIYNTYDWGGYLTWEHYPDRLVFWDGRQNSSKMFQYGWNVMAGQPDWQQILDQFDVNTIISKSCTMDTAQHYPLLDRLRESHDWSLVFQEGSSTVFVRNGSVDNEWLLKNRLNKGRIDDAILYEATLLVENDPARYVGWWEIARIQMERRRHREAFHALGRYLSYTPVRDPRAERYYRILAPLVQQ